jgi:rhamnogalacturonan endolyase
MMNRIWKRAIWCAVLAATLGFGATGALAQRQMEKLGRGVVAVNQGEGKVFVSWRLLGTEPDNIAFNLYRSTAGAPSVKLNAEPITKATCYQDSSVDLTKDNEYFVRPVINGTEGEQSKPFLSKIAANSEAKQYFSIPLKTPEGYTPNDCSVGDLDGDGEYEVIVHMTGRARDNSAAGLTDPPIFQAYKIDGTLLWTINLGKNIREGAHYTQFMVFDFDGDGKAEMICKTADGSVDGAGKVIGDPNADWVAKEGSANHRDTTGSMRDANGQMITNPDGTHVFSFVGRILSGPEYLTVFDGMTGKALATTNYVPGLGDVKSWGDAYGNRSERYLAGVAYLDGKLPSAVMCRGYYGRTTLCAWDWRDGKLTQRWLFDSSLPGNGKDGKPNTAYAGQGNHNLSIADVDGDGKDEVVYGSMCIDDDGKGLYSTGLGHGDAMHVSDLDPNHPGLEVFAIHEHPRHPYGTTLRDAATGKILWGAPGIEGQPGPDTGRGLAADVDPRYPGAEFFAVGSHDVNGKEIPVRGGSNFAIWWDGDLGRELLNGNQISKWNWETGQVERIFTAQGCASNNGSKSTPALSADLFGDWREELMERTTDNTELRIYTTVIPTEHRIYTLMHDPQYRESIAWQNVAYNQPPWTSFFLGFDMKSPPKPNITTERASTVR